MAARCPVNTSDSNLNDKINEWLKWNKDPKAEEEISKHVTDKDIDLLSKLFLKRLDFGTAGLRGCMGPGYSQMNDLVIVQTGQGLTKYLMSAIPNVAQLGVVIGYDARYNSKKFAELTAAILIANGIKVYLFRKVCPTPFISYTILKYKCAAGIMVTASHNPKNDNGYKVYWQNGAQIIPPHDKNIQSYILNNLEPLASSWDTSNIYESPLNLDPTDDIMESYCKDIGKSVLYPEINDKSTLRFVYTPLHGVGYEYVKAAFAAANFNHLLVVEEQKLPDPEFPTVKYPNPEEGKSALDLAIKLADETDTPIIIANDPDADRLACAEKMDNGEWHVYTGNELGALLGWWTMYCHHKHYPLIDENKPYMLGSTVSSRILASMARVEEFEFEETLTGFKWMGNRAVELMKENKTVLFAFEEAIGFMCGTNVLDKDGVSAAVRLAELSVYLYVMNKTLNHKLWDIYHEYGHHISDNSYFLCHNPNTIKAIFHRLRNYGKPNTYPNAILGGKFIIGSVRDLTTGYDSTKYDNKTHFPISKSNQMITFTFLNGLVTTLRTSGTEPKIKYYNELAGPPKGNDSFELNIILKEMVPAIISDFLQPEINGLIPQEK